MQGDMTIIYLKSSYAAPSHTIGRAAARGAITLVEQTDLTPEHLLASRGLVTGIQLDQNALLRLKAPLAAFLDAGGRWFFNGHLVRPLLDGMAQYQPIHAPKRADFTLSAINPHPIFEGIDLTQLETNKGVAGFYGRGCNPLPINAIAINGLGPAQTPVDWIWARPGGGRVFSHAGNDLDAAGQDWGLPPEFTRRIFDWAGGGACLDPWPAHPALPAGHATLAAPEPYGGAGRVMAEAARRIMPARRLVALSSGSCYTIRSLEGPRYAAAFDVTPAPEELAQTLRPDDTLLVPCRSPAQRLIPQKSVIARHLQAGGTVVALGESRSDLWLPAVTFTETPTNWWWWRDPHADLGVRIVAPKHPLMRAMRKEDVTWHLHGWFIPPKNAEVLATDAEGHAILYVDQTSTPGRMILSSLDPMYHHGSHFMPAATRFLDRFIPNLKDYLHG